MCRLVYMSSNKIDRTFLAKLFEELEKSAGGDGNGIGGFVDGHPIINKSVEKKASEFAGNLLDPAWDNGILFHTRRASVGLINDSNCHPYIYGDTITIHNGHIDGYGVLKLMMLENLEKYEVDGWTAGSISVTSDSDILSYFIWKRGFGMASMLDCGTVVTLYPDEVRMYNGYVLEAIQVRDEWIYASEFSDKMGMNAEQWLVFGKGTDLTISSDGTCVLNTGFYVDGKELFATRQKKKGKNKSNMVEVI